MLGVFLAALISASNPPSLDVIYFDESSTFSRSAGLNGDFKAVTGSAVIRTVPGSVVMSMPTSRLAEKPWKPDMVQRTTVTSRSEPTLATSEMSESFRVPTPSKGCSAFAIQYAVPIRFEPASYGSSMGVLSGCGESRLLHMSFANTMLYKNGFLTNIILQMGLAEARITESFRGGTVNWATGTVMVCGAQRVTYVLRRRGQPTNGTPLIPLGFLIETAARIAPLECS